MSASVSDSAGAPVLVEDRGATPVLALNRPAKRNALNDELLVALSAQLERAAADDSVRSVVLRGTGPCFSSGRDQKDAGDAHTTRAILQDGSLPLTVGRFTHVLRLLVNSPKPTVAAVHGYAFAGGQALTLACDFLVAERASRFGNPEIRFGFPAAMNTVLLARHLGRRQALEIALTGATYLAEDYWRLGLVNRLAEPGELDRAVDEFTSAMNELAPWAVRRTKELHRAIESAGMETCLHAGDALNQLLRANAQLQPVFDQEADARRGLKGEVAGDSAAPRR